MSKPKIAPLHPLTREGIQEATKLHRYNRVPPEVGKGSLKISGTTKIWNNNPQAIFLRTLRLVGSPADLQAYLESNNYTRELIQEHFNTAYTKANVVTDPKMKAEFEAEVAAAKLEVSKADHVAKYDFSHLVSLGDKAKAQKSVTKEGKSPRKSPKKRAPTGSPRGRPVSIKARLEEAVKKKQFLNVSKIKDTGAGTSYAEKIGPSFASIPEVPSVISNNADKFRAALVLLGHQNVDELAQKFTRTLSEKGVKAPVIPAVVPQPVAIIPIGVSRPAVMPVPVQVPVPLRTSPIQPTIMSQVVPQPMRLSPGRTIIPAPVVAARISPRTGARTIAPPQTSPRPVAAPVRVSPTSGVQSGAPGSIVL